MQANSIVSQEKLTQPIKSKPIDLSTVNVPIFNWSLGRKFSAFLTLLALVGCCLTFITLSNHLNNQAEEAVRERAQILLSSMQAARNYTRDNVQPMLEQNLAQDEDRFIPESIPNFAARKIFSDFRQHSGEFQDFLYKEAATNPTNPEDKADEFEAQLIAQMKIQRSTVAEESEAEAIAEALSTRKLSGYRTLKGEKLFYLARPLIMDDAKCLACHGRASDAPTYLLDMYGSEHGFNWQLNDIVAAQVMYVPAGRIFERSRQNLFTVTKSLLSIFGAIFLVMNLLLWRAVSRPLGILNKTAKQISGCSIDQQKVFLIEDQGLSQLATRRDEPGQLARSFEYMIHVLRQREQDLQQAVQERTHSLELEMRNRQTAQEALQTYSHAINHDLRNMVMGISNLLQVIGLRRAQQAQASDVVTVEPHALEMMQKSCDRQLQLMNSLMEVQSSDVWNTALQIETVDLSQLCQELQQAYASKLSLSPSRLSVEIAPQLPKIQADPVQIQRVFENLIGNALKYNPDGVQIQISVAIADSDASQIHCTVSDNGTGITAGKDLFKLYYRGKAAALSSGQGLGLYICRKIVEAHGGNIGCQSSATGGAEFWFTLPVS